MAPPEALSRDLTIPAGACAGETKNRKNSASAVQVSRWGLLDVYPSATVIRKKWHLHFAVDTVNVPVTHKLVVDPAETWCTLRRRSCMTSYLTTVILISRQGPMTGRAYKKHKPSHNRKRASVTYGQKSCFSCSASFRTIFVAHVLAISPRINFGAACQEFIHGSNY